ncbi:LruC domain-containing protein [Vibrio parahaemolyticus]|uniref:LruC domain-containing protein n=1 Tax=Vibrio parahaemolyticus TaxID=670 RepID=UPI00084AD0DA|nr:LruC domain-containing protein [Vibrio parahaemolyticus]EHU5171615.1 LruC domain-containing protein [Vibrio parahaemolyticus]EHV5544310.1 LruC domain-containing protein [Vibrio parahaemolyticus]ODX69566.1 LruC domain-containing protein [Vibrio parahaemolyticus]ODX78478.1 LruC domain-containing protein [Vibrio parahaemolyticus]
MKRTSLILGSLFVSAYANAAPFDTCPSKAYLFQSTPVQVYGVNLVTGSTTLLADDVGLASGINAVGFDFTDRYIYGYDTTNLKIVRLGKDFQAETLNVAGLPSHTFFVGDVYNHVYYLYRKGKGLFSIDLSPLDTDPNATLTLTQITATANVNLTDFAFHPGDGSLYGIDNNSGILYKFNTANGQATMIGDTGETGTFGAGYFDVNGNYYVSRNQDGKIYRINLSADNASNINAGIVPAVEFVSNGPSSSQNDGARCANAPVIDEDDPIDFGDAPDSYHTLLSSNGPRHEIDGVTWLGVIAPDGDPDGQIAPSGDNKVGTADEDGVGFIAALDPGLSSLVNVTASTSGYLSAWFDWNRDGDFADEGEQVFTDQLLAAGNNILPFIVSELATAGPSWSRFRFSQQTGLKYDGGSTSGEVEDHPITITENGVSVQHFPSAEGYATVAFEDNWPYTADYDMNDVVIQFRITETRMEGVVENIQITGDLAAYGAGYKNGFAIRLPGIAKASIENGLTTLSFNGVQQASNGLETISEEAIFIISDDLSQYTQSNCTYFRTQSGCDDNVAFSFTLTVYFKEGSDRSGLQAMPYDPFIFATPNTYHGDGITFQPGRKWEVHLPDQAPTEQFDDTNLYGLGVDASDPVQGTYFKTSNNLPWALLIVEGWEWPLENVDLVDAYPQFATYAESAGSQNANWHASPKANKCYIP